MPPRLGMCTILAVFHIRPVGHEQSPQLPQTRLPANLDDADPLVQLQACCFVDELDPSGWRTGGYEASEGKTEARD